LWYSDNGADNPPPNERPAHAYTYSFEPNPNWSSFYAYAPEIRQYFQDFADKYDLMPFVKLNSKVLSATWQEDKGICQFCLSCRCILFWYSVTM
jgi:hypothetical protein